MQRRRFLATSLAASAAALSQASAQQPGTSSRLFYELRRYSLITGPQMSKLTEAYLENALIPAANRQGVKPIGAFHLEYGPETPATYLLLPHSSADSLVYLQSRLQNDETYQQASSPFRAAAADRPAFARIDSQLLQAFESFPTIHVPATGKGQRIFQMRTYESPTAKTHDLKIEMFGKGGELEIFHNVGFEPVFFGESVIGPRQPNLTYMLTFKDLNDLTAKWDKFRVDPAWKKLSANERYGSEALVSNITNLVLSPTSYSQI